MEPITLTVINDELAKFNSIDKWNIATYTSDALDYIRLRSRSANLTTRELKEFVDAISSIKRFVETNNREDGEIVRKYAIKSCEYKIKVYNLGIAASSH